MGNNLDRILDEKIYQLIWWPKIVRPEKTDDKYWDSMIHPDDLLLLEKCAFNGDIFKEIGSDLNYVTITDGKNEVRINLLKKSKCLKQIKFEGLFYFDQVFVKSNNGINTAREGQITNMFYHSKDNCIIYKIESIEGKKINKQYKLNDLQLRKNQ